MTEHILVLIIFFTNISFKFNGIIIFDFFLKQLALILL